MAVILDLALGAACGFFKRDFHAVAEVATTLGSIAALASTAATTPKEGFKDATAATTTAEDFAEDVEGIMEAATAASTASTASTIGKGSVTVAVVGSAFLVVAEDVVGLTDLFEFVLGSLVTRVFIGVMLHRELAVSFLHVVGGDIAWDSQYFVIIAFVGHRGEG